MAFVVAVLVGFVVIGESASVMEYLAENTYGPYQGSQNVQNIHSAVQSSAVIMPLLSILLIVLLCAGVIWLVGVRG